MIEQVPAASYFMTGDNAEVSIDSRCWGTLPEANVVGRPLLRVLPLGRVGMIDVAPSPARTQQ